MIKFLLQSIYAVMSFCARPLVGTGIVHWGIFWKLDQLHAKIFRKIHTENETQYPTKHGFDIIIHSYDISIGRVLDVSWEWEPYISELIGNNLHEGDIFLDIWANVWYFSLLAARKVGQTGKVIAFEPAKKNYDLLIKNINLNGFDRVIVPYNMAVSDVSWELDIAFNTHNPGGTTLVTNAVDSTTSEISRVQVVTIDTLLSEKHPWLSPNFFKMDIEWFEKQWLVGMTQLFQSHQDIQWIFEFSPIFYSHLSEDCRAYSIWLLQFLIDAGFTLHHIHEERRTLEHIDDISVYYDTLSKQPVFQSNIFVKKKNGKNAFC